MFIIANLCFALLDFNSACIHFGNIFILKMELMQDGERGGEDLKRVKKFENAFGKNEKEKKNLYE